MGKNIPKERKEGMYKAILELKSLEECFDFFEDICAMTELRSMEQRFEGCEKHILHRKELPYKRRPATLGSDKSSYARNLHPHFGDVRRAGFSSKQALSYIFHLLSVRKFET